MREQTGIYPNLEECIRINGLRKYEIADALGITRASFSFKLHGRNKFTWNEARQIKKILDERSGYGYEYDYLFKEREE